MILLVGAVLSMSISAPAPEVSRQSVDAVLDSSYQRELPGFEARKSGAPQANANRRRRWPRGRPSRSRRQAEETEVRSGGTFGIIASVLLWVLVGVAALLLALFLAQEFSGYFGDPEAPGGEREGDGRDERLAVVQKPLGDADKMALDGQYDAAVHTLLLRTLEELARGLPTGLPRSYTSREILARAPMPEEARRALSQLVTVVELCHFGHGEATSEDFHLCRAHFQRFAVAYVKSG